ncbi:MAG: DUF1295 domain-containing protein [Myxococcota bacterium]
MIDPLAGFFAPWVLTLGITVLHFVLPGRWYVGYVNHHATGEKLSYRLNGLIVLLASVGLWAWLGTSDIVPFGWLFEHRWYSLAGACTFGLIFTFAIVLPNPSTGRNFVVDTFLGRLENPQLWGGRLDAKMWLYLVGAVILEINTLDFATAHALTFPDNPNPGIFLCAGLISYFVCDYLWFERVHLYTYDIFAERVGFKLGWGCLTFYPYFYTVALWFTADHPNPGTPTWLLVLAGLTFFTGWTLARGANMQKFTFKRDPEASFLGMRPVAVSDGKKHLLASGFWGVSRHVNYLGEVLMGSGIALSVSWGGEPWPWLYPLYYVLLLFPRQIDDDARCAEKYGPLWDEYVAHVRWRIIPFVW